MGPKKLKLANCAAWQLKWWLDVSADANCRAHLTKITMALLIDVKNMKLKHFLVRNLSEKGTVFCLSHNRVIFTFYSWRRNKMKMM